MAPVPSMAAQARAVDSGSTPKTSSASCSSSASCILGQALADSRSMAAGSKALRSRESSGSARRRETALARRSSNGASSKNA